MQPTSISEICRLIELACKGTLGSCHHRSTRMGNKTLSMADCAAILRVT